MLYSSSNADLNTKQTDALRHAELHLSLQTLQESEVLKAGMQNKPTL